MNCYIGIGSNLGDRQRNIDEAILQLSKIKGIEVKRVSNIYETDPMGGPKQGKYLNGVIEIDTRLNPKELMAGLLKIEEQLGRKRTIKNGPRTIDLDILLYGDKIIDEAGLKIPHPRMLEREFVIKPMNDLGINLYDSVSRQTATHGVV